MGHPLGYAVLETLGADRVITQAEVDVTNIFTFDPAAARNLDLPAEADNAGIFLFIANAANAAEVITIRDDAAGTVCTPTQNETAIVFCDGVSWRGSVGSAA
jgi:hypothetical protein